MKKKHGPAEELEALDAQYRRQAAWFRGVRANLLRRVGIGAKRQVLELGCGTGVVTEELTRRCRGQVFAMDMDSAPLRLRPKRMKGARPIVASGEALPFADGTIDLVFTQMLFMWLPDPGSVAREAARVLKAGCELLLVAEPDFGGRIEHPEASRLGPRMSAALRALGADPEVARKMPQTLAAEGFQVNMGVHPSLYQPDELAAAWEDERGFLESLGGKPAEPGCPLAFLFMPYFWFLARKGR